MKELEEKRVFRPGLLCIIQLLFIKMLYLVRKNAEASLVDTQSRDRQYKRLFPTSEMMTDKEAELFRTLRLLAAPEYY